MARDDFRQLQGLAQKLWKDESVPDENSDIDQSKLGWGDKEYPSADWIRWLLMGGDAGWHWARTTKELASAMGEKL